jgi:hypothetical protein
LKGCSSGGGGGVLGAGSFLLARLVAKANPTVTRNKAIPIRYIMMATSLEVNSGFITV